MRAISSRSRIDLPDSALLIGRRMVKALGFEDLAFTAGEIKQLFREVSPTLKLGIRFEWGGAGVEGAFNYPFGPLHVLDAVRSGVHQKQGQAVTITSIACGTRNHDQLVRHMAIQHESFLTGDLPAATALGRAG